MPRSDDDPPKIELDPGLATRRVTERCRCGHPVSGRSQALVDAALMEHWLVAHKEEERKS